MFKYIKSYKKILKMFDLTNDELSMFLWNSEHNATDGMSMLNEDQSESDFYRLGQRATKKKVQAWVLEMGSEAFFFLTPKGTSEKSMQDIIIERINRALKKGDEFDKFEHNKVGKG